MLKKGLIAISLLAGVLIFWSCSPKVTVFWESSPAGGVNQTTASASFKVAIDNGIMAPLSPPPGVTLTLHWMQGQTNTPGTVLFIKLKDETVTANDGQTITSTLINIKQNRLFLLNNYIYLTVYNNNDDILLGTSPKVRYYESLNAVTNTPGTN